MANGLSRRHRRDVISDSASGTAGLVTRGIACGFALLLLIDLFSLLGGLPLASIGRLTFGDVLLFWTIPYVLAMALVFLGIAKYSNRLARAHIERYTGSAGLVTLSGALLLVFQATSGVTAPWLMTAAAVLVAAGGACLLSLWEWTFIASTDEETVHTVLIALILSSATYLVLARVAPAALLYLFPVIVCAAAGLLILTNRRPIESAITDPSGRAHTSPRLLTIVRLIRDPLLCVAAIVFAIAITRTVTLNNIGDMRLVNISGSVVTLLGAGLFFAACYVLRGRFGSFNILRFYRVLFPTLTTVLLLPIFRNELSLLVAALVYFGYTISFVLILPTCLTLARQDGTHVLAVFGVFMGSLNLVSAIATGFAMLFYQVNYFGAATFSVGILLALYVLGMTYSLATNVRRRREHEEGIDRVLRAELARAAEVDGLAPDARSISAVSVGAGGEVIQGQVVEEIGSKHASNGMASPVSAIAAECLLTGREHDVLQLLAQGRDVPTIARQLFISENTVRTHAKSIYLKLNVHSRQELLDRVEEFSAVGCAD